MRQALVWTVTGVIAIATAGCGGGSAPAPVADAEPKQVAKTVDAQPPETEMTVEVGCAGCIYKMEGVTGCTTAAKVQDHVYLVEGGGIDAHTSGLCQTSRQATVVGRIEGDKLIASRITLQ